MKKVQISLTNAKFSPNYTADDTTLLLRYPCQTTYECADYFFTLPPGKYKIEAYGGSGGSRDGKFTTAVLNDRSGCVPQSTVTNYEGNTECRMSTSVNQPGSGAYMSGVITLRKDTFVFASIAGMGEFISSRAPKGGYNGGGDALYSSQFGASSGGGSTDIKFEVNDLYHRVLVAGGGGGIDNAQGTGGSGGYEDAQGYWIESNYHSTPIASQLYGFSFGQGESAGSKTSHPNSTSAGNSDDVGAAGGGWFGGFCSGSNGGGAGGGSSFILTKTAKIPEGKIKRHTGRYVFIEEKEYAFIERKYSFDNVQHANGIWGGNGQVRITLIKSIKAHNYCTKRLSDFRFSHIIIAVMIYKL